MSLRHSRSLPLLAGGSLLLGGAAAAWLAWGPEVRWDLQSLGDVLAIPLHAILLPLGLVLARGSAGRGPLSAVLLALCAAGGLLALMPGLERSLRAGLVWTHVGAGVLLLGLAAAAFLQARGFSARHGIAAGAAGFVLLSAGYAFAEARRSSFSPPEYDGESTYRFLTATTAAQAESETFPSALRTGRPPADCRSCHDRAPEGCAGVFHSAQDSGAAYPATLADFTRRQGTEAARWCRGCHEPEALRATLPSEAGGLSCASCHTAEVHGLYGSAALTIPPGPPAGGSLLAARLRPHAHTERNLNRARLTAPELCAGCHRKAWNLPQNRYRWMPGPDEYGDWQESRFSGAALYAAGTPEGRVGCTGCHTTRDTAPHVDRPRPLGLDLFFRRPSMPGELPTPAGAEVNARPGEPLLLDVVVRNDGVGHDFPYGMPDLYEAWLEVRVRDRQGREVYRSGVVRPDEPLPAEVHAYRLVALDRDGKAIRHGDLDRMVAVREWRRIPAGETDLARYELRMPAGGIGRVEVRLLRRRRPEMARWLGERPERELHAVAGVVSDHAGAPSNPLRWAAYGTALGAVQAYPHAIQALSHALAEAPSDAEALLALGRVYLDEGDLLAAQGQFERARHLAPGDHRPAAWLGAVLRRMGQPAAAVAMLRPLTQRFPRDRRLRYELGLAHMAELRHGEAAREFEAMLDVDPVDVAAHYNLMLSFQRLNRLTEARREETLYRLLARDDSAPAALRGATASPHGRALVVRELEAVR
ncbi:MAG: tetratricopeptide repeat protein [Armatimonadota bacterium]